MEYAPQERGQGVSDEAAGEEGGGHGGAAWWTPRVRARTSHFALRANKNSSNMLREKKFLKKIYLASWADPALGKRSPFGAVRLDILIPKVRCFSTGF